MITVIAQDLFMVCFWLQNLNFASLSIGVLSQKITFKGCDQNIAGVGFKDFRDLEKGKTVRNMSKLKWKRDLDGVKTTQWIIGCENCREDRKCQSCNIDPTTNCFECEPCRSCDKCLKTITQIKYYTTKINKLKRSQPNESGHMLPYYIEEETEKAFVEEKNIIYNALLTYTLIIIWKIEKYADLVILLIGKNNQLCS